MPTRRRVFFLLMVLLCAPIQSWSSSRKLKVRSRAKMEKFLARASDNSQVSTFLQNGLTAREELFSNTIRPNVALASAKKYAFGSNAIILGPSALKNG